MLRRWATETWDRLGGYRTTPWFQGVDFVGLPLNPYLHSNKPLIFNLTNSNNLVQWFCFWARSLCVCSLMRPRREVPQNSPSYIRLTQLPFCKQSASVSPLFAAVRKSAHPIDSTGFSLPLFSYSYELFSTSQNLNPFPFKATQTLLQKHRGWGYAFRPSLPYYVLRFGLTRFA